MLLNKIKENPDYNFNPGLSLIDLRITGPQSGPGFNTANFSAYPGLTLNLRLYYPIYQISATLEKAPHLGQKNS